MNTKELQTIHDQIWREIYERQKLTPEPNVVGIEHCANDTDIDKNDSKHSPEIEIMLEQPCS